MSEFTDINRENYPYVSSPQARHALTTLAVFHAMTFTQNPGGGEFWHPTFGRCQIHMCDDVEDYEKVRAWLDEQIKERAV